MTSNPTPAVVPSPLHAIQEKADAVFIPYNRAAPIDKKAAPDAPRVALPQIDFVATFGEYEAEYAMIRKGVGIIDLPTRGVVEVRGKDRLTFLHSMLTHDTKSLKPGEARRAFMLGKTGRVAADLIVLEQADRMLIELDIHDAAALPKLLDAYLFSEDVVMKNVSEAFTRLSLHGPSAIALIESLAGNAGELAGIANLTHRLVTLAGHDCVVFRHDETGSLGLHLMVARDAALPIYTALTDAVGGICPEVEGGVKRTIRGRGIGWLAYNTARIEAGVPLLHVDFGPDSLPHETGLLKETVSFTKGCYLGQEVVARMQNLGHPKRILAGLRFDDERMPISGSQVIEAAAPTGTEATSAAATGAVIGGVTSSTLSPMLGGVAIAFATVKWGKHLPGTKVLVPAEGSLVPATVQALNFLP